MRLVKKSSDSPTGQLASKVSGMVKLAMMTSDGSCNEAVFAGLCAIGGAAGPIAAVVARKDRTLPPEELVKDIVNDKTILFVTLLAAAAISTRQTDNPERDTMVQLGPDTVLQAMEYFELITGEKPDQYLDEPLVTIVKGFAEEANNPLNTFLKKEPPTDSKTLN